VDSWRQRLTVEVSEWWEQQQAQSAELSAGLSSSMPPRVASARATLREVAKSLSHTSALDSAALTSLMVARTESFFVQDQETITEVQHTAMLTHLAEVILEELATTLDKAAMFPEDIAQIPARVSHGVLWALAVQHKLGERGVWCALGADSPLGAVVVVSAMSDLAEAVKDHLSGAMLQPGKSGVSQKEADHDEQEYATHKIAEAAEVSSPASPFRDATPVGEDIVMSHVGLELDVLGDSTGVSIACPMCRKESLQSQWRRIYVDGTCVLCLTASDGLMLAPCDHALCQSCLHQISQPRSNQRGDDSLAVSTLDSATSNMVQIDHAVKNVITTRGVMTPEHIEVFIQFVVAVEDVVRKSLMNEEVIDPDQTAVPCLMFGPSDLDKDAPTKLHVVTCDLETRLCAFPRAMC